MQRPGGGDFERKESLYRQDRPRVALQYDGAGDVSDGLAAVKQGEKWGSGAVSGGTAPEPQSAPAPQPEQPVDPKPTTPPAEAKTAAPTNDKLAVNGVEQTPTVYKIGDSNYFKLRDLGKALDFYVGWSADQGVYIETDKPYS